MHLVCLIVRLLRLKETEIRWAFLQTLDDMRRWH
jgi:hypothetical protein